MTAFTTALFAVAAVAGPWVIAASIWSARVQISRVLRGL